MTDEVERLRRQRDEAERRMHNAVRFYGDLAASIVRVRRAVDADLCGPCAARVTAALDAEPAEVNLYSGSDEEFLASLDAPRCDFDCYECQGPNHPEPLTEDERRQWWPQSQIRLCDARLFTKADDPLVCRLSHGHPGDHADPDQQQTWRD